VESESTDIKLFDAGLFQIQSPASPAPTQGTPKTRQSMRRSGLGKNKNFSRTHEANAGK